MRKLMLMGALVLALPAVASAQEGPRKGGRGMAMLNTAEFVLKNKAEINATAEQVSKIEEISKKFDKDTEQLRAELQKVREEMRGGTDRQTIMQKMRPLREELQKKNEAAKAEVLKLLNDEQKKTVSALLETRREEMKNRRPGGGRNIQKS
jgi:hypothetical protein